MVSLLEKETVTLQPHDNNSKFRRSWLVGRRSLRAKELGQKFWFNHLLRKSRQNLSEASRVLFNLSRRETLMMRRRHVGTCLFLVLSLFFFFSRKAGQARIRRAEPSRADSERDVTSQSGFPCSPACLPLLLTPAANSVPPCSRPERREGNTGRLSAVVAEEEEEQPPPVSCLAAFDFYQRIHPNTIKKWKHKKKRCLLTGHINTCGYFFFFKVTNTMKTCFLIGDL